ncbi:MAG: N-acetylmuramoyl-L-alanine amidase [Hyphomicrobium sp.]|nr:N-acetylmuramoyl-L-alanine amidase [Hyphomicrobium sp.]
MSSGRVLAQDAASEPSGWTVETVPEIAPAVQSPNLQVPDSQGVDLQAVAPAPPPFAPISEPPSLSNAVARTPDPREAPEQKPSLADTTQAKTSAHATDVRITGDASAATFEIDLSVGVTAEVFTLASPYRVIIDLPNLAFALPNAPQPAPSGLVMDFRYGLFAEGKARVVIDTAGPVQITSANMTKLGSGTAVTLKISLAPVDVASFGGGTGASRSATATTPTAPEAPAKPKSAKARPVIVIDPGHGGIDPGALGASNIAEKSIVLDVARQLKAALVQTGKFDVRMTRSSDVFISLDRRLKASLDFGADLFVSLHADSIEETAAAELIRGATVYTLSERASDEEARKRAEKENASDLIAGLENKDAAGFDQVKSILIDLIKRENSNFSADYSNVVAGKLSKNITMSRDPQRSAAFKVLKQSHAPSVLIELGYMSNSEDRQQMMTLEWQQKVAKAITGATVAYFSKRSPH